MLLALHHSRLHPELPAHHLTARRGPGDEGDGSSGQWKSKKTRQRVPNRTAERMGKAENVMGKQELSLENLDLSGLLS